MTSRPSLLRAGNRLREDFGPSGSGSGWARPWTCSTQLGLKPTAPHTPTTWPPSRPWLLSTPTRPPSRRGSRAARAKRPGGPAVLLSTIHKIKGREWEHVIVYGATKGLFPHRLSDDEEGERRVFHVALTRAIRQVVVLADTDECSPFVLELDGSRDHRPITGRNAERTRSERGTPSAGMGSDVGVPPIWLATASPAEVQAPDDVGAEKPAELGLTLAYGGHSGSVIDLTDTAAVFQVGEPRLSVLFGSEVRVQGSTVILDRARNSGQFPGVGRVDRACLAGVALRGSEAGVGTGVRCAERRRVGRYCSRGTSNARRALPMQRYRAEPPGAMG